MRFLSRVTFQESNMIISNRSLPTVTAEKGTSGFLLPALLIGHKFKLMLKINSVGLKPDVMIAVYIRL